MIERETKRVRNSYKALHEQLSNLDSRCAQQLLDAIRPAIQQIPPTTQTYYAFRALDDLITDIAYDRWLYDTSSTTTIPPYHGLQVGDGGMGGSAPNQPGEHNHA